MNRMEFGARDRWIDAAGRRRRARRGLRIEDREEERDDGYAMVMAAAVLGTDSSARARGAD